MTEFEASPQRAIRTMCLAAVAGALVAALLGTPAIAAAPPPRPLYLALGDSVAAGVGAQPPATEGYVPELHHLLTAEVPCGDGQALACRLDLLNIAEPGATTTTLLARQLPRAISLIQQRRTTATPIDDVRLITLDIGGSDAFGPILQACSSDPQAPGCATTISTVLGTVTTNLRAILSGLREAAGPDTTIAVMTYYNPLPACVLAAQTSLADLVLEGGGPASNRAQRHHPRTSSRPRRRRGRDRAPDRHPRPRRRPRLPAPRHVRARRHRRRLQRRDRRRGGHPTRPTGTRP